MPVPFVIDPVQGYCGKAAVKFVGLLVLQLFDGLYDNRYYGSERCERSAKEIRKEKLRRTACWLTEVQRQLVLQIIVEALGRAVGKNVRGGHVVGKQQLAQDLGKVPAVFRIGGLQ